MASTRPSIPDTNTTDEPRDDLDVANRFVSPTSYNELLELVNMGTGYYEDEDLRLQMRSFRKGLVADVAFDGALWERAVYETKVKLADEGFQYYYDTDADEPKSWAAFEEVADDYEGGRTAALQERGEEIWDELSRPDKPLSDEQAAAMAEKASIQTFKPVFWQLLAAYHEASKSKDARTQDNFFGRVKKHLVPNQKQDPKSGGLLSRGSKS